MVKICNKPAYILMCLLLSLAGGCSSSVNLQVGGEKLPIPLASQLPLALGVHYTDEFRNYVFEENSESRKEWKIDYQKPRLALFAQILPTMFRSVEPVTEPKAAGAAATLDLILEPEVIETQVALPDETRSDNYEAWIKYGIKLYQPGGELIAEWQLTGYGRSQTAMFTSKEQGINTAINLALRDIGAKLVLDFQKAPGVREWLAGKINCTEFQHLC